MGPLSEIPWVEAVLLQEAIEIGPVFPCEVGGLTYVPVAGLEEFDEVAPLKGVSGFFEGPERLFVRRPSRWENKLFRKYIVSRHGGGVFEGILQFPHISSPVVEHQFPHGLRGYPFDVLFHLLVEPPQEMLYERRDVLLSVPERREVDRDYVNPVEKVAAEEPFLYLFLQVFVRGKRSPSRRPRRAFRSLWGRNTVLAAREVPWPGSRVTCRRSHRGIWCPRGPG